MTSLPLWERGFKQRAGQQPDGAEQSLPLWERGFKRHYIIPPNVLMIVAPLVGAWI